MAAIDTSTAITAGRDQMLQSKKFKISDLPLNSSQRASVDGLLHSLKKKGEFDAIRKKVWAAFEDSDAQLELTKNLEKVAESEIDRDSSLLSRDRRTAAPLIEGAVDRSGVYRDVEARLDALILEHLDHVEVIARSIRRQEVGEEKAAMEEQLGSKTDQEYAQEVAGKRTIRDQARHKEEARGRKQAEKEKLLEMERRAKAELDKLRIITDRKKAAVALAEKRRAERVARKEAERKASEEKRLEREAAEAKRKQEEEDHEKERKARREAERRRYRSRSRRRSRDRSRRRDRGERKDELIQAAAAAPMDDKALEQAALEMLLQEGRDLAAKSGPVQDDGPPKVVTRLKYSDVNAITTADSRFTFPKPRHSRSDRRSRSRSRSRDKDRDRDRDSRRDDRSRTTRRRSRSRSRNRSPFRDHQKDPAGKEEWKRKEVQKREEEAARYKREMLANRDPSIRSVQDLDTKDVVDRTRSRSKKRRERSRTPVRKPRDDTRHKSPIEIDRYVPSSRHREKKADERPRNRDTEDKEKDVEKDQNRTRARSRNRDRERNRDRSRDREKNRDRSRDRRDKDRVRSRSRARDKDRDRSRQRRRSKDRDTTRDKDGHRRRDRSGDRDKREKDKTDDKDRDYDRRRRDSRTYSDRKDKDGSDKRGWIEIDRYVPGKGSVSASGTGSKAGGEKDKKP